MMLPRNRSLRPRNRRSPRTPCLKTVLQLCSWLLSLLCNFTRARIVLPMMQRFRMLPNLQDKKKAELDRQKELAELFAVAIKQPKVPVGKRCSLLLQILYISTSRVVGYMR